MDTYRSLTINELLFNTQTNFQSTLINTQRIHNTNFEQINTETTFQAETVLSTRITHFIKRHTLVIIIFGVLAGTIIYIESANRKLNKNKS
jgi:hypothetical protein